MNQIKNGNNKVNRCQVICLYAFYVMFLFCSCVSLVFLFSFVYIIWNITIEKYATYIKVLELLVLAAGTLYVDKCTKKDIFKNFYFRFKTTKLVKKRR